MALETRPRAAAFWVAVAVAGAVLLTVAPPAQARQVTLNWEYGDPSRVDYFLVYTRALGGSYGAGTNVGLPAPVGGVYSVQFDVSDSVETVTAIQAFYDGQYSPFSNERSFASVAAPPPGPSGTLYTSDGFSAVADGDDPAGWVDTMADSSLAVDDSLFKVYDLSGDPAFGTLSGASHIHSHYSGAGALALGAYEYSGRMMISDPAAGIGVTVHSQFNAADVYYRLMRSQSGAFQMRAHPAGTAVSCTNPSTGVVPAANTWYRFRLRVVPEAGATRINARVWRADQAEPAAWQMDCYDDLPTRLSAGTFGVWSSLNGGKFWDDLSVTDLGTGPAPDPGGDELGVPGVPVLLP